uniref:Uncharacterized protein n=1 Tax=viral metagenome TaxID=1070528 RepID=A0A6C0C5J2_9ZZZZ
MLNNVNEMVIFFLIIIFIILSYYDLKYSIIFFMILFLVYIYSNKIINKPNIPDYTNYTGNTEKIFYKLKKYERIDPQSYKLGLKYYKYFIKNIKIIYKVNDNIKFKSLLENAKIYLDTSIEKFNSIIFSINTYDSEYEKEYVMLINDLKIESDKIIQNTITKYDEIKKCNDLNNFNYNMFCDNEPIINLFTISNVKPDIYNKIYIDNNMFDYDSFDKSINPDKTCHKPELLNPIENRSI